MDVTYDKRAETTQRWVDSDLRSFENGVAYDATFSTEGNLHFSRLIGVNGGTGNRAPELDPNGTLKVNVDEMGININDLRTSIAFQRWFERNARGGIGSIANIFD